MKGITSIIALSFSLIFSTQAFSQEAPPPAPQAAKAVELTSKDKDAFVKVYGKIQTIQQKYTNQLNDKSTPEEVNKVSQTAQAEMAETINKEKDIDIPKYNQILMALESDQKLREEIQEKLQKNM